MQNEKIIQMKELGEIYGYEENIEILIKILKFDKKTRFVN